MSSDPNYEIVKKEFFNLSNYILNIYDSLNQYCTSLKDIYLNSNSFLNITTNCFENDHPLLIYNNDIKYQIENVFNEWSLNQQNNFQIIVNYLSDLENIRLLIEKYEKQIVVVMSQRNKQQEYNSLVEIFKNVKQIFDSKTSNFDIPLINIQFSFNSLFNSITFIHDNSTSLLQQPINFKSKISNLQPINNNNVSSTQSQQQQIPPPQPSPNTISKPVLRAIPRPSSVIIPNNNNNNNNNYYNNTNNTPPPSTTINQPTPPTISKRPVSMILNNNSSNSNSNGGGLRPAPPPIVNNNNNNNVTTTNTTTPQPTPNIFKKPPVSYQRPTPASQQPIQTPQASQQQDQKINQTTPTFQRPTPTYNKPSPSTIAQQRPNPQPIQTPQQTQQTQQTYQKPNSTPSYQRPSPTPSPSYQRPNPSPSPTPTPTPYRPQPIQQPIPVDNNYNNQNKVEKKKEKDSFSLFGKKLSSAFKGMEISSFQVMPGGVYSTETEEDRKKREESIERYYDIHRVNYNDPQPKLEDLLVDFREHQRMWDNGKRFKLTRKFVQSIRYTSSSHQTIESGTIMKGKPLKYAVSEPVQMISQDITNSSLQVRDSRGNIYEPEYYKVGKSMVNLYIYTFPSPQTGDTFYFERMVEADLYRVLLEEIKSPNEPLPYVEPISEAEYNMYLIPTAKLNFDKPEFAEFINTSNLYRQSDGASLESILCFTYRVSLYIKLHITYVFTAGGQEPLVTIASGEANCSSFSNLFTSILRYNGIPCRIINGLVHRDDPNTNQGLHAQTEFYVDDIGWVPYNGAATGGPSRNLFAYGQCFADLFSNMIDTYINLDICYTKGEFYAVFGALISPIYSVSAKDVVSISKLEHTENIIRIDQSGIKLYQ